MRRYSNATKETDSTPFMKNKTSITACRRDCADNEPEAERERPERLLRCPSDDQKTKKTNDGFEQFDRASLTPIPDGTTAARSFVAASNSRFEIAAGFSITPTDGKGSL